MAKTAIEPPPGGSAVMAKTAVEAPPAGAKAASEPVTIKLEDGTELKLGDELGAGSTSTAYKNRAAEQTEAIRITRDVDTTGLTPKQIERAKDFGDRAEKLDDFGRKRLKKLGGEEGVMRLPDGTTIRTPRVIKRVKLDGKGEGVLKGAKALEVVERAPKSFNQVVKETGKGMTPGQAIAFDKAHRYLNDNNLVWLDNHAGNYGFRDLGGDKWEFWIIDPGGIVPVGAAGGKTAAQVARDIQKVINDPPKKLVDSYMSATTRKQRDKVAIGMIHGILRKHGDSIDMGPIGLSGPDKLIFNPAGVLPFKRARTLFNTDGKSLTGVYDTFRKTERARTKQELGNVGGSLPATGKWEPGQAAPN